MQRRHTLIWILWLVGMLSASAAEPYTISVVGNEGSVCQVSDTRINTFYKDSDGFIWVGTGTTVERLSGKHSLVYTFNEEPSLLHSPFLVNAIIESRKHDFWVGTINGVWHMNHATRQLERAFSDDIHFPVQALARDENHTLYVGTLNGLYVYDGISLHHVQMEVKEEPVNSNPILDLAVAGAHAVWMLTANGVVLYDHESGTLRPYRSSLEQYGGFTCLSLIDNFLYIGTDQGNLLRFDTKSHVWTHVRQLVAAPVMDFSVEDDKLGVATRGAGIRLLSLSDGDILYESDIFTNGVNKLLSNEMSSILLSEGNIWCGTGFYQGMNLLRPVSDAFQRYAYEPFLSHNITIRCTWQSGDYTLIGNREGFYSVNERTGETAYFNKRTPQAQGYLRSDLIFSFYEYDGVVLVGTCDAGLAAFLPQTNTFIETPLTRACTDNDIFMALEDEERVLWLATSDGLYSYDKRTHRVTNYNAADNGLPGNLVYGIYIDSQKRFWLATDRGLAFFDPITGTCSREGLPDMVGQEPMRGIFEGRDGTLFLIFLNRRLLIADNDLTNPRFYPFIDCNNMTQDGNGYYWCFGENGLLRMDEQLNHYRLFTEAGVLQGTSGRLDAQGRLWVGNINGLYIIDPKKELRDAPVRITEVLVKGNRYADCYTLQTDSVLSLTAEEDVLTFRFASLDYRNPSQVKYEYLLQGRDSVWQTVTDEESVSLFNLPPGGYVFKIRELLKCESEDMVRFTIRRSYVWVWISLIVVFALLAIVLWLQRRRKELQKALPIDAAMTDETETVELAKQQTKKTQTSLPMTDEVASQIAALRSYVETEKPYLNVNLMQSDLAAAIGISTSQLSVLFKKYMQVGYYDFINEYRIKAFKQAVADGLHNKYTLSAMAEMCGFRAKASFFRAADKFLKMPPNEYIQSQ